MVYTEKEIVKSYKDARSPKAQIAVLAELNGVTPKEIKSILVKNGALEEVEETKKEVPVSEKIPLAVIEAVTIHKRKIEKHLNDLKKDLSDIENFLEKCKTST